MNLKHLSNQELENQLLGFVKQERKILHVILLHIREVDIRKLYLEKPRSSLFEYLTKDLGYSSSAAQRRIEAARLIKYIPALPQKIQSGAVSLSQIGELARAIKQKEAEEKLCITPEKKQELLAQIENKNSFETQRILAQELDLQLKPFEVTRVQKDNSVNLQITLSQKQHEKLTACKDLAAHILLQNRMGVDTAAVLEVLMDQFLKSKGLLENKPAKSSNTPESKEFTAKKSKKRAPSGDSKIFSQEKFETDLKKEKPTAAPATNRVNKSLTTKTKRELRQTLTTCQYRNPRTQQICGSRFALETEHITPRWAHGTHAKGNLSLLCSPHNKLTYQQQMRMRPR